LEEAFLDALLSLEGAFVDERLTVDRIVFGMTVPEAIVVVEGRSSPRGWKRQYPA
jgi:hypothetical protein